MSDGYDPGHDGHDDPYGHDSGHENADPYGPSQEDTNDPYGSPIVQTADFGPDGSETVVDENHDGYADAVLFADGDGHVNTVFTHSFGPGHQLDTMAVDTNGDGRPDLLAFDHHHTGRPDEVLMDRSEDGHGVVDFKDTNGDGTFDTVTYADPFQGPQEALHGGEDPYTTN
jgi:hypothetical protein